MSASHAPAGDNESMVLRHDEGPVAVLTLNRPAARNSLSRAMIAALQAALDGVAADDACSAAIMARERLLRAAGRFSVRTATGPSSWRSTTTRCRPPGHRLRTCFWLPCSVAEVRRPRAGVQWAGAQWAGTQARAGPYCR